MQWECRTGQTKVYIDAVESTCEVIAQIAELPIELEHVARAICNAHNADVEASTGAIMNEVVDSWRYSVGLPAIER